MPRMSLLAEGQNLWRRCRARRERPLAGIGQGREKVPSGRAHHEDFGGPHGFAGREGGTVKVSSVRFLTGVCPGGADPPWAAVSYWRNLWLARPLSRSSAQPGERTSQK